MADINAVRISTLTTITFAELDALDQFVINDVDSVDGIETKKLPLGGLIEYIENQELVFEKGIIVNGEIKPPAGNSLDIYANNLFLSQSLNLDNNTIVNGLYLNKHLEDVNVESPKDKEILSWDDSNKEWINIEGEFGIEEAPLDGKIYARQNGQWVDITDKLGGGGTGPDIGSVTIRKTTPGSIVVNTNQNFTVLITGDVPTDIEYEWFVTGNDSDKATITNADRQSCTIVFSEEGIYTVNVRLTSDTSSNSPLVSSLSFPVGPDVDYILQESGGKILGDGKNGFLLREFVETTPGPGPDPDPDPIENPVFNTQAILDTVRSKNEDPKYTQAFENAINRWHKLVRHTDLVWSALQNAYSDEIWTDGAVFYDQNVNWGGSIGSDSSLLFYRDDNSSTVATTAPVETIGFSADNKGKQLGMSFAISINKAYENKSVEWWSTVITHELGHVLGVNNIWQADGVPSFVDTDTSLVPRDPDYVKTLDGFNLHQAIARTRIPLENASGAGTASSHWDDQERLGIPAFANELMTGFVNDDADYQKITSLTLGCLEDYRYNIIGDPEANPILSRRTTSTGERLPRCGGSLVVPQRRTYIIS